MVGLYFAQLLVPPGLIAWVAFAPARNWLGFAVQYLGTGLVLVALARLGVWLFPPWWAAYVFGAMLAGAALLGLLREAPTQLFPIGMRAWTLAGGFIALAILGAYETALAWAGGRPPHAEAVALAWPLAPGDYLVVNGGSSLAVNAHADALDQSIPAHRIWRGTAYGVDIVSIDAFGLRATGVEPRDPGRYRIFGTPVFAPCAGEIVVAVDGLPDMPPPEYDMANLAGNHVVLRCAEADIILAHFRRGSVLAPAGARVSTGQKLAEVGNSGGTNEPHLHIHAQSPGTSEAPISGAPLPIRFEGRWLVRSDRWHEPAVRGPAP